MTDEDRTPPRRVRVTKLQEAQLADLEQLDLQCAYMYYNVGVDPELLVPRTEAQIAALTHSYDVLVAEADHLPAGYLAWADQAPGVAYIDWIAVHPDYQRFGIGTRLLREMGEAASKHGIKHAAITVQASASWAMSFLAARGFQLADAALPDNVAGWRDQRAAELSAASQQLWWVKTDGLGTIPGLPRPT